MTITIRPLRDGDFEGWLPLWKGYLEFYETSLPEPQAGYTFKRMIDPEGDLNGIGAFDEDGRMVGMTTWLVHPTTWSQKMRVYLNDLFTLPELRGQGVGRQLIEAVVDAARAIDAEQVYWTTQEHNYAGRMLYDKVATRTPFIKYVKAT